MSETHHHKSHKAEYFIVFVVLGVLTVLELMIPGLKTLYAYKAAGLVGLAIAKAFVVAYFYMHLKDERGWLKFIAAIPIVAAVYAIMLILESTFR